uniref:alpha-glucosidase n=1 Tax=Panstrongylus lignarius TaxID=156445 RepID=A0A224XH82_9HEMI
MGRKGLLSVLLIALQLTSSIAADLDWWKSAVIYQIYPRSFKDTDGNGVGDLQGILENVKYIKDLGVDAVWLTSIYPTNDADFGYDITDMRNVYNTLGNLTVFGDLLKKLHDEGIKLILDFVPNHTSNKHDWFLKSIMNRDKYGKYYVWRAGSMSEEYDAINKIKPPNNWAAAIGGGDAWTYDNFRKEFYLHQFLEQQPDLNYENEDVIKDMTDVLDFWLHKGVDGFRMAGVFALCENQDFADEVIGPDKKRLHEKTYDQPKNFNVLAKFRAKLDEYTRKDNVTRLMIVESNSSDFNTVKKYYGTKDAPIAHFPFNFFLIKNMNTSSNATDWARTINNWYKDMGEDNHPNWVLGNHDQHRVANRFTSEYVDLLNILILSLKGTVITYYGEELGMPDSIVRMDQAQDPLGKKSSYSDFLWESRDPARGPFLWNGNKTAGFSSSLKSWIPVSPSYWQINAKTQNDSDRSHLKIYKEMISLRKNLTLKSGDIEVIDVNDNVLAVYRYFDDNPSVVVVINFGSKEEKVNLLEKRKSLPESLNFYLASSNINDFKDKDNKPKLYKSSEITLPPKAALVLTT